MSRHQGFLFATGSAFGCDTMDGGFCANTSFWRALSDSESRNADLCGTSGHYLLLGIRGSGMRALAEVLLDAGCRVTGTDVQLSTTADVLQISAEWQSRSVSGQQLLRFCTWNEATALFSSTDIAGTPREELPIDCIAMSAAVSQDDVRIQAAQKTGLPTKLLAKVLAEQFCRHQQLCVSGTHGKSTTTALLWWILESAGHHPSAFVGGQMIENGRSGYYRSSRTDPALAVIESCEYRGAFLELSPALTVLTGIERDHFDCYPTAKDEDQAFQKFLNRMKSNGLLIVNGDCPRAMYLAVRQPAQIVTCGLRTQNSWQASGIQTQQSGTSFDVSYRGARLGAIRMQLPGVHNVRNALTAIAAASETGIRFDEIASAIGRFRGIHRRFEFRQTWRDMQFIDDYAHHPGAINVTISAARQIYSQRRLIVAFEPHQISRTEKLFDGFCQALRRADECLILPVLAARETATESERSRLSAQLVRGINRAGGRAFLFANLDQVVGRIDHSGRPGDVLITMGAGRTNTIHDEFHRRLQRDFAA